MSVYSQDDDHDPQADELRETSLVTLEALISSCSQQMQPYLSNTIKSALRFLKYDPNVADNEDDEEMGGTQDDGSDGDAEGSDMEDDEFEDFPVEGEPSIARRLFKHTPTRPTNELDELR